MDQDGTSPTLESPLAPAGHQLLQRAKARHQRLLTTRQAPVIVASPWLPVAILTAFSTLVFFALPPLSAFDETEAYREWGTSLGGLAMTAAMGAVPAQIILLGLIVACSPSPLWRRLLVLAGQLLLILTALTIGSRLFEALAGRTWGNAGWRDELILITTLPAFALLSQWPFWFARLALGWELARVEASPGASDEVADDEVSYQQSPSKTQLIVGTAITLACFGLLLFTPPAEYSWEPPPSAAALLTGALGFCLSLFIGLPLVLFFTRVKWRLLRWGIPLILASLLGGVAYAATFLNSNELELNAHARFIAGQVTLFFIGGVGGVALGLAVFRWFGWTVRPVLTRATY